MLSVKNIADYRIFIAIIAFNEKYLQQTIDSALTKADHSDRIYFGVLEHRTDNVFSDFQHYNNVKHIHLHYDAVLGVGVPRTLVLQLYNNEDFILQIDAHMIFDEGWDSKLIANYLTIIEDTGSQKIVITGRPAWWTLDGNNHIVLSAVRDVILTMTYKMQTSIQKKSHEEFLTLRSDNKTRGFFYTEYSPSRYMAFMRSAKGWKEAVLTSFKEVEEWLWSEQYRGFQYPEYLGNVANPADDVHYMEHHLFSAHFAFASSQFFHEIVLDPRIQFGGEEQTMAMRGWTRGFRFFSIRDHILWHLDKSANYKDRLDRLFNPGDNKLTAHYHRRLGQSMGHVEQVLTGEILGDWGAPDLEALKRYEKTVGLNFKEFYQKKRI